MKGNTMLDNVARTWVERTLSDMTIEKIIGQLLCPIVISWDTSLDFEELADNAIRNHAGSVFFAGTKAETMAKLSRKLIGEMEIPPLISADFELGPMGIEGATRFGDAMALGAISDPHRAEELAYECGRTTGIEGRAVGINWAFGPVVDIPMNHESSLANIRCWSGDPQRISRLAAAYARGLQEQGIAATLKHFPGDGVDARDQHITTSVNPLTIDAWRETYARTFGYCMNEGAYSVMIGHIAMPSIGNFDPRTRLPLPATLDERIVRGLLRDEMGFDGVVVSDALGMVGILGHCRDKIEATVRSLAIGCDVALFAYRLEETVAAVFEALRNKQIQEEQLVESARRILTMKAKLGLHKDSVPPPEEPDALFRDQRSLAVSREVAETSLSLIHNHDGAVPLQMPAGGKIVICNLPQQAIDPSAILPPGELMCDGDWPFLARSLAARGYRVVCVHDQKGVERETADADALVYIFNNRPNASMGHLRLSKEALRAVRWEILNGPLPSICVSLGSPFVAWELAALPNLICGYSPTDNIQEALAKALLGEIPLRGRLPVEIPE